MMETLTIIAYQQPVTRADVDAIRGVQASEMIRQLLDRDVVLGIGDDAAIVRPRGARIGVFSSDMLLAVSCTRCGAGEVWH